MVDLGDQVRVGVGCLLRRCSSPIGGRCAHTSRHAASASQSLYTVHDCDPSIGIQTVPAGVVGLAMTVPADDEEEAVAVSAMVVLS